MSSDLNSLLKGEGRVEAIKRYLETGERPEGQRALRKRLADFELVNGEVVYKPLGLVCVPQNLVRATLEQEWADLRKSAGKGISGFYGVVTQSYAGITREDVELFLKKKGEYQLRRQPVKVTNKSILAREPRHKLQIDLIDFSRYEKRGYRYIVTVVDVFTRYIWLRAIKRKEADVVRGILAQICDEDNFLPRVIISDLGGEFRGEVTEWCKENGIKQENTRSYSPLGLVETINKQVRKMVMDSCVRENSDDWVRFVKVAQDSWNSSTHSGVKHTPEFLFLSSGEDVEDEKKEALGALVEASKRRIEKNKSFELRVGNVVRVSLRAISSAVRREYKEQKTRKWIPIQWSDELFRVKSQIAPDRDRPVGTSKRQYTLEHLDGTPLTTERQANDARDRVRRASRFFASELLLVAKDDKSIPAESKLEDKRQWLNRPLRSGAVTQGENRTPATRQPRQNRRTERRNQQPTNAQPENPPVLRRSARERRPVVRMDL